MRQLLSSLHLSKLDAVFPHFRARSEHAPTGSAPKGEALRIRWLGAAGHVVEIAGVTILLDPFLTRPSLTKTVGRRLRPRPDEWMRWLPRKIDAICLGHSHYDHLMDAPAIARRTGALIIGSASTARFARAERVSEDQIVEVPPSGKVIEVGDAEITFVPSLHGRIAAGRVPLPGEADAKPKLPARLWHYRMGGAYGVHIAGGGTSVYHNGSADLIDAELAHIRADVMLVGLAGRKATRSYLKRLVDHLDPKLIVPTHHDGFFTPLEDGVRLLPGIDLDGFFSEATALVPEARIVTPTYKQTLNADVGDPREVVLSRFDPRS